MSRNPKKPIVPEKSYAEQLHEEAEARARLLSRRYDGAPVWIVKPWCSPYWEMHPLDPFEEPPDDFTYRKAQPVVASPEDPDDRDPLPITPIPEEKSNENRPPVYFRKTR